MTSSITKDALKKRRTVVPAKAGTQIFDEETGPPLSRGRLFQSFAKVALAFLAGVSIVGAEPRPILVGAVVSETGPHADLAFDYRRALVVWQEKVNAEGGLLGRKVELRLLDDGSAAANVGPLYAKLLRAEKADLLIGPYGSAASLVAAAEAETARHVIVNGAAPSRVVHRRAPRYVFQAVTPYAAYGARVIELAKTEGIASVFVLARDDPAVREMAEAARQAALAAKIACGEVEIFSSGIDDYKAQVAKAQAANAQAWIAFGEVRDAAQMVKTFKLLRYAPKLFFARGAEDPKFISLVGQDAEYTIGIKEYDANLPTPGNEVFVKSFSAKWSAKPTPAAAEGYSAASVLAAAVARAASLDQEKLRATLASLDIGTVLGRYKVDPATGVQIGAKPALFQIVRGKPQFVPPGGHVLPYPAWTERRLLK
jgi:branched-chain amino acid transport system substrate-binding protein